MNPPAADARARQVATTCRDLGAQPGLPIAEHLPEDQILDTSHDLGGTYRPRVSTPATTLWTFLPQGLDPDHSCAQAVDRLIAHRAAEGLPDCSDDTGASCKARARLPEGLLHELVRQVGRGQSDKADRHWLWKGRRVKVVDGTGLSMPDTADNQEAYPQPKNIKPGVGFPLLRLVVIFCLATGTALEAAMGRHRGKGTGAVSLFRDIDDVLGAGDVLLGGRNFSSYWEVARAQRRGVDVVVRRHAGRRPLPFRGRGRAACDRREGWRKPPRPSWMTPEGYESYPEWLPLRAVRVVVRQRGFRTRLVLVTALPDAAAYRASDLAELYRRRWQAELNLRWLKTVLQMDVLRGQSPDAVRKEVWAHLLVYNLVRAPMGQAAVGVRPDELSFTGALHAVNAFLPKLEGARAAAEASRLWARLVRMIGRRRVGDRPDRYEPRVVKRRPKNYPKLPVPRAEARRQLGDNAKETAKKG